MFSTVSKSIHFTELSKITAQKLSSPVRKRTLQRDCNCKVLKNPQSNVSGSGRSGLRAGWGTWARRPVNPSLFSKENFICILAEKSVSTSINILSIGSLCQGISVSNVHHLSDAKHLLWTSFFQLASNKILTPVTIHTIMTSELPTAWRESAQPRSVSPERLGNCCLFTCRCTKKELNSDVWFQNAYCHNKKTNRSLSCPETGVNTSCCTFHRQKHLRMLPEQLDKITKNNKTKLKSGKLDNAKVRVLTMRATRWISLVSHEAQNGLGATIHADLCWICQHKDKLPCTLKSRRHPHRQTKSQLCHKIRDVRCTWCTWCTFGLASCLETSELQQTREAFNRFANKANQIHCSYLLHCSFSQHIFPCLTEEGVNAVVFFCCLD